MATARRKTIGRMRIPSLLGYWMSVLSIFSNCRSRDFSDQPRGLFLSWRGRAENACCCAGTVRVRHKLPAHSRCRFSRERMFRRLCSNGPTPQVTLSCSPLDTLTDLTWWEMKEEVTLHVLVWVSGASWHKLRRGFGHRLRCTLFDYK